MAVNALNITAQEVMEQVMGARIKDMTGATHSTFHRMTRILAQMRVKEGESLKAAYVQGLTPYTGLLEKVMDAHKPDGCGPYALRNVAKALLGYVQGKDMEQAQFEAAVLPFLTEEEMESLTTTLTEAGVSVNPCKTTAFGALLAGGRRNMGKTLAKLSLPSENIFTKLQADAFGDALWNVTPDGGGKKKKEWAQKTHITANPNAKGLAGLLDLLWDGKPLFPHGLVVENTAKGYTIRGYFQPYWLKGDVLWRVELELPKMEKLSATGHFRLTTAGEKPRFFKPRVGAKGYKRLIATLRERFIGRIERLATNKAVSMSSGKDKLQETLNMGLWDFMSGLPIENDLTLLTGLEEYEIEVSQTRDLLQKWAEDQAMYLMLAKVGKFDLLTTSKSAPGTTCYRAWKHGLPKFILQANPFAHFGPVAPKRRGEYRSTWGEALKLKNPVPMTTTLMGEERPEAMASRMTKLRVAVVNIEGVNMWDGKCHDTLNFFRSAMRKTEVEELVLTFTDKNFMEDKLQKFRDKGVPDGNIIIRPTKRSIGFGANIEVEAWDVTVISPGLDSGKVKSFGPKGVMNVIPGQASTEEEDFFVDDSNAVDAFVPLRTIDKKMFLDWVILGIWESLGLGPVDPDWSLNTIIAKIEEAGGGPIDTLCRKKVYYHVDGQVHCLGEALVIEVPWMVTPQMAVTQFSAKAVRLELHAMILSGIRPTNTKKAETRLNDAVRVLNFIDKELSGSGQEAPDTLPEYEYNDCDIPTDDAGDIDFSYEGGE